MATYNKLCTIINDVKMLHTDTCTHTYTKHTYSDLPEHMYTLAYIYSIYTFIQISVRL